MNPQRRKGHRSRAAIRAAIRAADVLAAACASRGHPVERRGRGVQRNHLASAEELVRSHFAERSNPDHINFPSLYEAIRLLSERPCVILETGSSAWGTDSSRLFDDYVAAFGGEFWSVDVRFDPVLKLGRSLSGHSTLCCDDSVRFLRRWVREHPGRKADLVYLDSMDLDVGSPVRAAAHAIQEFFAISPALHDGSLLLIDDTPASIEWFPEDQRNAANQFQSTHGVLPGKGMLIHEYLKHRAGIAKLRHEYQVLYRFGANSNCHKSRATLRSTDQPSGRARRLR